MSEPVLMFGVGAAKSGTSWLHRYLDEHPECHFRAIKELQVQRLFQPLHLDTRGGAVHTLPVAPCRYADGRLRTFYHSDYFRSASRWPEVPPLTGDERALLDAYEEIALDPAFAIEMDLEPGDIQLLSNHTVLHARTGYDDEGPDQRRHLLRLWVSLDPPKSTKIRLLRALERGRLIGRLVRRKLEGRLRPTTPLAAPR